MHKGKHIRVRGIRREPDIKKLSRAIILLARAQVEKEAQESKRSSPAPPSKKRTAS